MTMQTGTTAFSAGTQTDANVATAPAPQAQEQATAPATAKDPIAEKQRALEKRERMLYRRDQEIRARAKELESKLASAQNDYQSQFKQKLTTDFWGTAIEAGLTPDQIIEHLTNKPSQENTVLSQIQLKLKALEDQNKQLTEQSQKQEQAAYEQARKLLTKDVGFMVKANPSDFRAIQAMNAHEAVVDLIDMTLNPEDGSEGYMMDVTDAAKEVEAYLRERLQDVYGKINPAPKEPPQAQQQPAQSKGQRPTQTLSHQAVTASVAAKQLTPAQRRERAIRIAQGLPVD